jgi:hypothetical protein
VVGPKADAYVVGPSGLESALGARGWLEPQVELLSRRQGRQRSLWRRLRVKAQDVGRELLHIEHPLETPMVHRDGMARLDDPREFTGGAGMGQCQTDDLWLDLTRHTRVDRWLAARMGEGPAIEEADNPRVLKAPEIRPESVIRNARRAALLDERGLALEDGAQDVIASEGLLIRGGLTDKEIELR